MKCFAILFLAAFMAAPPAVQTQRESLEAVAGRLAAFGEADGTSYMKVGRTAVALGKAIGTLAIKDSWLKMVMKAFRKVHGACVLDYGDCPPEKKALIEASILPDLIRENLVYSEMTGPEVSEEVFGERSKDGEEVSDLVIVLHGQLVVCIRGTIKTADVPRTVGRLKRQL